MNNSKNILLTGITGLLGSFLARELIDQGYGVFGLARPGKGISAKDRVINGLKFVYGDDWNPEKILRQIKVIEGDIIGPNLHIRNEQDERALIKNIDIIIHSAALAELNCQYSKIRKINVDGTRYVLDFAMRCRDQGRLKKFNYISTMYVAGKKDVVFDETMYEVGQEFNNTYERTKFEAEGLVRQYLMKGLNCSIFRPSMIVGDSTQGKTSNFRLVYQPLHFFAKGIYDIFPADLQCKQNLIHVDVVAKAIAQLSDKGRSDVYHVISPNDTSIELFTKTAAEYFNIKMPVFVSPAEFDFSELTPAKRQLAQQFVPYFSYKAKFSAHKTYDFFDQNQLPHPEFNKESLIRIFEFCEKQAFIRKN